MVKYIVVMLTVLNSCKTTYKLIVQNRNTFYTTKWEYVLHHWTRTHARRVGSMILRAIRRTGYYDPFSINNIYIYKW